MKWVLTVLSCKIATGGCLTPYGSALIVIGDKQITKHFSGIDDVID